MRGALTSRDPTQIRFQFKAFAACIRMLPLVCGCQCHDVNLKVLAVIVSWHEILVGCGESHRQQWQVSVIRTAIAVLKALERFQSAQP